MIMRRPIARDNAQMRLIGEASPRSYLAVSISSAINEPSIDVKLCEKYKSLMPENLHPADLNALIKDNNPNTTPKLEELVKFCVANKEIKLSTTINNHLIGEESNTEPLTVEHALQALFIRKLSDSPFGQYLSAQQNMDNYQAVWEQLKSSYAIKFLKNPNQQLFCLDLNNIINLLMGFKTNLDSQLPPLSTSPSFLKTTGLTLAGIGLVVGNMALLGWGIERAVYAGKQGYSLYAGCSNTDDITGTWHRDDCNTLISSGCNWHNVVFCQEYLPVFAQYLASHNYPADSDPSGFCCSVNNQNTSILQVNGEFIPRKLIGQIVGGLLGGVVLSIPATLLLIPIHRGLANNVTKHHYYPLETNEHSALFKKESLNKKLKDTQVSRVNTPEDMILARQVLAFNHLLT